MKKSLLIFVFCLFSVFDGISQKQMGKRASLGSDGTLKIDKIALPGNLKASKLNQVDLLFSFGRPANAYFKNVRGTTLADIDGDGNQEILYGIDDVLYVLQGNGTILWSKSVSGFITYPPTVYDIDQDGTMEIILNTRAISGATTGGRVYLMDNLGNDLPGWPLNFLDHGIINAPVVSDLNNDGSLDIIVTERVNSTQGYVHAVNFDGTPINSNWPVSLPGTPAFTPSIGDIDNNGTNDLVISTVDALYVFDNQGVAFTGFPVTNPNVKYSYQSPILADLDGHGDLEIIGSNHGDSAGFYVRDHDGSYYPGWPIPLNNWVYSPPTVADVDNDNIYEIFLGDRKTNSDGSTPSNVIYGLTPNGTNIPNFPISKYGGNESVLGIADLNNDNVLEIIFTSITVDANGYGFVHAYSLDGSGEINGFPVKPKGFTFLNAALVGDVNDDGMMDLTTNSYTMTFGSSIDSTFVNVYNLNVPYNPSKILRNGYKGSNSRDGLVTDATMGIVGRVQNGSVQIHPNPSKGVLKIVLPKHLKKVDVAIYNIEGRLIFSEKENIIRENRLQYNFDQLETGIYFLKISGEGKIYTGKWIKK